MADVFVSYASPDRAAAGRVVDILLGHNLTVWWDQHLHTGAFFQRIINHELLSAKVIVVLWSEHSVSSEWVLGEAMIGLDRGAIVSAQIGSCVIPVPFNAQQVLGLDAAGIAESSDLLLRDVQKILDQHGAASPTGNPIARPSALETASKPTLAVLPFEARGADEAEIAELIAAEVITSLSRFSTLEVVPRRSSFAAGLKSSGIAEVSTALNCQYVISGRLQVLDSSLRLLLELSDGLRDRLVWSGAFEDSMRDVSTVAVHVAEKVARQLGGEFLRSEVLAACAQPAGNLDVWRLLSNARAHFVSFNVEALTHSLDCVNQALRLSPEEPQALALRASILAELVRVALSSDSGPAESHRHRASTDVARALQLAADDPVVLKYCGSALNMLGEAERAIGLLRDAVSANPYDLGSWGYLADALVNVGEEAGIREALDLLTIILEESPRHPGAGFWHLHRASAYTLLGRPEEAIASANTGLQMQPDLMAGWWVLVNALAISGDVDRAVDTAARARLRKGIDETAFRRIVSECAVSPEAAAQRTRGLAILAGDAS